MVYLKLKLEIVQLTTQLPSIMLTLLRNLFDTSNLNSLLFHLW